MINMQILNWMDNEAAGRRPLTSPMTGDIPVRNVRSQPFFFLSFVLLFYLAVFLIRLVSIVPPMR